MSGNYVLFSDDLGGDNILFAEPEAQLVAWDADEFDAVLAQAERHQAAGKWLAGYLSYEAGYLLEPKLAAILPRDRRVPLCAFGVFDRPRPPGEAYRLLSSAPGRASIEPPRPAMSFAEYEERFARLHRHLRQGDCYQANLTFEMRARYRGDPLPIFNALRDRQPVPHGALVVIEGPALVSRSPELFFRVDRAGFIESWPMKGTAPRGRTREEDAALKRFLANDPKNRSENIMIVDLLRNDISHVCEAGSVEVPTLFHVDSYATVHQMISRVRGRLRPQVGLREILAALFPCGSITGAPKIRAMEILAELEGTARNAYCGAIGWISPGGAMEFNVAIRTLSLYGDGEALFNVGGGVIFESTARSEYEECLLKSRFATLPEPVSA